MKEREGWYPSRRSEDFRHFMEPAKKITAALGIAAAAGGGYIATRGERNPQSEPAISARQTEPSEPPRPHDIVPNTPPANAMPTTRQRATAFSLNPEFIPTPEGLAYYINLERLAAKLERESERCVEVRQRLDGIMIAGNSVRFVEETMADERNVLTGYLGNKKIFRVYPNSDGDAAVRIYPNAIFPGPAFLHGYYAREHVPYGELRDTIMDTYDQDNDSFDEHSLASYGFTYVDMEAGNASDDE